MLSEKLRADMLDAARQHNEIKLSILKLAIASLKNEMIAKGDMTEQDEVQVLRKEVKKLKDAIEQYNAAGRKDLADREIGQLEVLESYLPKLMSEDEVREVVKKVIAESGAESVRDMGKVMGLVMRELQGKAEGSVVNNLVKELLS